MHRESERKSHGVERAVGRVRSVNEGSRGVFVNTSACCVLCAVECLRAQSRFWRSGGGGWFLQQSISRGTICGIFNITLHACRYVHTSSLGAPFSLEWKNGVNRRVSHGAS